MGKDTTLYIVDGSSYIFRAYYAIRHLSNSKGLPTNAIFGFTQMLLRLIKDFNPEHLVMVFDTKEPTFRKKEYELYKANREVPPEDLVPQFDYIKKVVQVLNIPQLELAGYEADDIIATLVRRHLPKGYNSVIITGDKDLMQLVDDRVQLLDTMKDKRTGIEGVKEKFGVRPDQVIDILALAGDSSDNVPGVPGIGPKTASQLIQSYDSLENLYENLGEIKGKKGENLKKFKDQAFLSKRLVTLHDNVPVKTTFNEFSKKDPITEECRALFEELEFTQLMDSFGGSAKKASTEDYKLVRDEAALEKLIKKLRKAGAFAFDTETTSLNVLEARLVGLSFSTKAGEAYYIPVGHETDEKQLNCEQVIAALKPILEDKTVFKYAQNFKYDAGILLNYNVKVQGLKFDTLLASYLLDPAGSHKLDNLALKYIGHKMISFAEVTGKKTGGNFKEVSIEDARKYSCEDADITFQLTKLFSEKVKKDKLENLLVDLEQPLTEVLLKMERWGVKLDIPFLKKLQKDFGKRILEKKSTIYEVAGEEFNIQSPKQLAKILFEKLDLPVLKKTKTGFSTDMGVLTELSQSHDLPKLILEFRSLAKLKSTYVDALIEIAQANGGRVHTSFNQTIAETGRLSSSNPNLQNIPIRSEDGAKIRQAFIADEGFSLMSADYSQIELRVLAHMSGDPVLLKAFKEGEDIHRLSAASIFQVPESEVVPSMRAAGKTVNFAVIYGQTPFGLSKQLGVSQKEAKNYIDQYFHKYQGVKAYRDQILKQAQKSSEVRTLLNRRRFVPDINSKNFGVRQLAERVAFNTVIQGTAADIIKKAMLNLDKAMKEAATQSRMLLQVHDELVFEVKKGEEDLMRKLAKECMEGVVDFKIPLSVEIGEGKNWKEAH